MKPNYRRMKYYTNLLLLLLLPLAAQGQKASVSYQPKDSVRIEQLLRQARHMTNGGNKVLWFARQFIGKPYVAHTLEQGDPERLVINLDQLDCTTYVDVVTALTLASSHGKTSFGAFCYYLRHQRYANGVLRAYPSRNHYFTSWILNGERQGFVHEVSAQDFKHKSPFTATQTLKINFMSKHPQYYDALKRHPEYIKTIRTTEQQLTGLKFSYIPKSSIGGTRKALSCIHNGDILCLTTSKEGLDIAHLGFAVWQSGRLHLLNASSIYHKVLIDSQSLYRYQQRQSTQTGVRVVRILQP